MSSTVARIQSTGATMDFINTATTGSTTKTKIMLPIHHKIITGLSFPHESFTLSEDAPHLANNHRR